MTAPRLLLAYAVLWLAVISSTGCRHLQRAPDECAVPVFAGPRELDKAVLPEYVIEPPDLLTIDALNIVPKSPYLLRTLDVLQIDVTDALPDEPISNAFPIQLGGSIDLGHPYGSVKVTGMTLDDAKEAIIQHLSQTLKDPKLTASLVDISARQQIAGEHLVGPDGTVTLGTYGKVSVIGLTVPLAKRAIEDHLSHYLENPEVSVDVFGYNSKVYYVITEGALAGDGVYRFSNTGNETVLDAISQINGLGSESSINIWIARPGADDSGRRQVMPVNWQAITREGDITTNYQVLPGDRVYVAVDELIKADVELAKFIAPLERILGFTLLSTETVTRLSGNVLQGGGNPIGRGGGF